MCRPFGEPVAVTGVSASLPFGFSTKYLDGETGLHYYGLRYYNPSTGRWINRDPIGEKGGVNLYRTVDNNLVNLIDKLGLCTWTTRVAHGSVNRPYLESIDNGSKLPNGDRLFLVSCGGNNMNGSLPPEVQIPGSPSLPQAGDGSINDTQVPGIIDASWANMEEQAPKECGCKGSSCTTIKIRVECADESAIRADSKERRELFNLQGQRYSLEPKCGKERTYDCATKKWLD